MGTTTEKLTYLQGTKDAIKNAIVAKGVAVSEGTTFRGYAEKIGEIQPKLKTVQYWFWGLQNYNAVAVGTEGTLETKELQIKYARDKLFAAINTLVILYIKNGAGLDIKFNGDQPIYQVKNNNNEILICFIARETTSVGIF